MPYLDLGGLDAAEIGDLMQILAGTDVEECEIQQGDMTVSLKRTVSTPHAPRQPEIAEDSNDSSVGDEPLVVASPAVGVFYRAEERTDEPSVQDGTLVKAGEVIGVVEVLGVPHPVRSTVDGMVEHFLVEDGEAVEYGQPIAAIS